MAWQDKEQNRGTPTKAYSRPVGRSGGNLPCRRAKSIRRSLARLTGGLAGMFWSERPLLCLVPWPNKQTSENQSRLMIAENLVGGGAGKLHRGPSGHRDKTALRTNRNMVAR